MMKNMKDYATSGLDIQYAVLDQAKRYGDKVPRFLRWGQHNITTADFIAVPEHGIIRGEFLSVKGQIEQGFDLKLDGYLVLGSRQRVSLLRTWYNRRLPNMVEYPFYSNDLRIRVWNVYKRPQGANNAVEEKWTGNAGFWIEELSETERIYHCSNGMLNSPDFESLVFRLTILPHSVDI